EILASQKLYADARTHLNTLIELRKGKGDTRGALHAKVRLGSLDPEDYDARLESARARVEMGDKAGALRDLKEIAAELAVDKGRQAQAIDVLREAATLNPDDEEVKEQLFDIYLAGSELPRAREFATTVEQFRMVASAFEGQGHKEDALETLRSAVALNDADTELKAELARAFVAKGDLETAAQYLTVKTAGDDPDLLLTVADMRLRGKAESVEEGLSIARQ